VDLPQPVDLKAYFRRIGYGGDRSPSAQVLEDLHLAHATHIPFENLDILLGRAIRLDLESLQAKLVRGGRGGYCFEQNELFASVLEQLGFPVTRLAARVRLGTTRLLPRSHMLLKVDVTGEAWLADVGFGTEGLLKPIRLLAGEVAEQYAWQYRLDETAGAWVLQSRHEGNWQDLYVFSLEPQFPVDYEVANYYVSTHPDSRFVQTLTAQQSTPEARYLLRNRDFSIARGTTTISRQITDDDELLRVLAESFGLLFPEGTRFPVLTKASEPPSVTA
jgi:N-hydroxyarylamine O-acetyltransferase